VLIKRIKEVKEACKRDAPPATTSNSFQAGVALLPSPSGQRNNIGEIMASVSSDGAKKKSAV